jgi:CHAD domain-containing protein
VIRTPQPSDPFRERLAAFVREFPGLEQGSVQALHRARVASRRLRELLPLMAVDRETARTLQRRLRDVTQKLGDVRELDVLLQLIEELRGNSVRYRREGLEEIETAVARARHAARERLPQALPLSKLQRLAARLERADKTEDVPNAAPVVRRPKRAWLWALEARMAQRAARVRSAIDVAGTLYAPDRLHDGRIAVKKLRYVMELLHDAGRQHVTSDLDTLKSAQDLLGRLHDFEVLMRWGREAQASLPATNLGARRELALLLLGLEDDCRRMHGRYMRDRAALLAIADRLGAVSAQAERLRRPSQSLRAAGRRGPGPAE